VTGVQTCALPICMSIQMQDGKHFDGDGRDIDMSQVNLDWKNACAKFLKTADRIIGTVRAAQLVERISDLENAAHATEIASLIRSDIGQSSH